MAQIIYSDLTDEEIFARIKQDDRTAFSELYHRYWKQLLNTAFRRLDSLEQAEELVQDLFVSMYLKRKEIEITDSLQAYMNTSVKYKILNHVRGDLVRQNYQQRVLNMVPEYQADVSEILETKELQQEINKSLNDLPEKCQQAYLLSREKNLPYKQIAEQLDISVNTVEKHIGKALKILRSNLKEFQSGIILLITLYLF